MERKHHQHQVVSSYPFHILKYLGFLNTKFLRHIQRIYCFSFFSHIYLYNHFSPNYLSTAYLPIYPLSIYHHFLSSSIYHLFIYLLIYISVTIRVAYSIPQYKLFPVGRKILKPLLSFVKTWLAYLIPTTQLWQLSTLEIVKE